MLSKAGPALPTPKSRLAALFALVAHTAGRRAVQRAAPLYFAILVAASIIFSPVGMRAADVTKMAADSRGFRVALWGLWLLASAPAARTLLGEPSLGFLRSLPVPRWQIVLPQAVLLFVAELPMVALFGRGHSLLAGLASGLYAMAAHGLYCARLRRWYELVAAGALLGLLLVPAPFALVLFAALVVLLLALPAAWVRAPERDTGSPRALLSARGPAVLALAMAYVLTLWRGHAALLTRFALLVVAASVVTALAILNNGIALPGPRAVVSIGVLAAPMLLGAAGIAAPVLRSERQSEWLLASAGTSGPLRVAAALLAIAGPATLFGILHAVLLGWLLAAPPVLMLRLGLGAAATGATLAVIAGGCVRAAQRGDKRDGERLFLWMLLCIPGAALTTYLFQETVLAFWLLAATIAAARQASGLLPRGRWRRLRNERLQQEEAP